MFDVGSPSTPRGLAWQLAALFTPWEVPAEISAAARQPFFSTWVASVKAELPCHERCLSGAAFAPFTGLG